MNSKYAGEIESEKHQANIYIDTYYNKLLAYEGYKDEVVYFMEDAGISKNSSILDVGCGTGWFLSLLQRQGWSQLNGLDISPDMLVIARKMLPNATYYEAPIQEINDVHGGGYDVITCLGTLHHMPDIEVVAEKLFFLLKPGGKLIVHEPNEDWFYEQSRLSRTVMRLCYSPLRIKNHSRIKALREPWKRVPPSPHHEDIHVEELITKLQQAGFKLVKTEYKNALMRVVEGMLFRNSSFDRKLYSFIRSIDRLLVDKLARNRGGAALLYLERPQ